MKKILAMTAALLAVSSASAVERPYASVAYLATQLEFDRTNPDVFGLTRENEFILDAVQFRGGTMLTRHFGLEAHLMSGVGTAEEKVRDSLNNEVGAEILEIRYAYGIYGVARIGSDRMGLYAYAGYNWVRLGMIDTMVSSTTFTEDEDGLSYGAGVEVPFLWNSSLELDYKSMLDENNYTLSGVSLGIRRHF